MAIIVMLEIDELRFQIRAGPAERSVQVLAANGSDQSLHEWVRQRYVGNGLDFHHFEYAKIGLPLMKSIQRIMIRAEVFRKVLLRSLAKRREGPVELRSGTGS